MSGWRDFVLREGFSLREAAGRDGQSRKKNLRNRLSDARE
jgi:hypothetical protein